MSLASINSIKLLYILLLKLNPSQKERLLTGLAQ
jgi:hypothetical protein